MKRIFLTVMMTASSILLFSQTKKINNIQQNNQEWSQQAKDIRVYNRFEIVTDYGNVSKNANSKFIITYDNVTPIIFFKGGRKVIIKNITEWETNEYGMKSCKVYFNDEYWILRVYKESISIDNGTERYDFWNH